MTSYRYRTIKTDGSKGHWSRSQFIPLADVVARCERDLQELHILGMELQRYAVNGRIIEGEGSIRMIITPERFQTILDGSVKSWIPKIKKAYKALIGL